MENVIPAKRVGLIAWGESIYCCHAIPITHYIVFDKTGLMRKYINPISGWWYLTFFLKLSMMSTYILDRILIIVSLYIIHSSQTRFWPVTEIYTNKSLQVYLGGKSTTCPWKYITLYMTFWKRSVIFVQKSWVWNVKTNDDEKLMM